jgi:hypothetical protein
VAEAEVHEAKEERQTEKGEGSEERKLNPTLELAQA